MSFKFLIISVLLGATTFSCTSNEKRSDEVRVVTPDTAAPVTAVAQNAAAEGTAVKVMTADVPDSIRSSFNLKYPRGVTPQWFEYTPVESDELPMDEKYYYVMFVNTGNDVTEWYNKRGQWVRTATKVKGDPRLPDAVNRTLNAQYPGYKIEEVDKENDKDMEMFEIKLRKGDNKAKLKVLPNGTVFKRK